MDHVTLENRDGGALLLSFMQMNPKYSNALVAALIAYCFCGTASSQARDSEPLSRIEGVVVAASNGRPLDGVGLRLRVYGAVGTEKQYASTSGSDGRFVITDIPKGRYVLAASRSGYINQEYGQARPDRPGAILDLTTAQTVRDVTIRMSAGGVISGRVTDQNAQPLEGTLIRALNRRYERDGTSSLSEVANAVTNDIGEYRMYWLAPGTYYLVAAVLPSNRKIQNPTLEPTVIDQSQQPLDVFPSIFFPNGDDDSQATPIRLEPGSEARAIDFSLVRTKAVRVKGKVINGSTGQPVTDALVQMRPKFIEGLEHVLQSARTDNDGNFEFRNASPGAHVLLTRWTEPGFRSMYIKQDLQIGNKDVSEVQLVLQAYRGITGRVVMERGEPVPQNRTVLLFKENSGALFGTGLLPDGSFVLSNVSTGVLHVELTGFPDSYFIRSARAGNRNILRDGLNLSEESMDSVELVIGSQGGTVEGVISDERQSPVVGAHVVLIPTVERRERPDLVKEVSADQYGRFTIHGVMPGDYKVFAWDDLEPNIFFDASFMEQYESKGRLVHVNKEDSVKVSLQTLR